MKPADGERSETVARLVAELKRIRTRQGLSQNVLAKRAGINQSMIGRLEKGERLPSIDTLLKWCNALEVSLPALLDSVLPSPRAGVELHSAAGETSSEAQSTWNPAPDVPVPPRAVRMADIAAQLGLSRLTVSAVLNNRHDSVRISDETADKVRVTAKRLGYVRNHLAIATKTGRSFSVGAIVSDFTSEWVSRALSGFIERAKARNYLVQIEDVAGPVAETTALRRFIEQRVGGIFCCNLYPDGDFPEHLAMMSAQYGFPVVSSTSHARLSGLKVNSDDATGGALAARHLWDLGHRRIGIIGLRHNRTRAEYFIRALKEQNGSVPPHWDISRSSLAGETEAHIKQILTPQNGEPRPSALFCSSDELAAITLQIAHEHGLRVPQDLSIIGFSNERIARLTTPSLTTISQPFYNMGAESAELLFSQIQSGAQVHKTSELLLPVRLVLRESTAPPPPQEQLMRKPMKH